MTETPMPAERISLMGIFDSEAQTASAIRGLRNTAYGLERVHSPIPSHIIADALGQPKSKVGWFTLAGGITGFLFGFFLSIFTATRWSLIISGKPVVAYVPFFIVGFEFTILFAVCGNLLGLISQARLPRFRMPEPYDPRFSGHKFGVLASCTGPERGGLVRFLEAEGAEVAQSDPAPAGTGSIRPKPGGTQA